MNIYLRYFQEETLVTNCSEAIAFLESISEIDVDDFLRKDLQQYLESDNVFPKRYKVHSRSYFIVIKTMAKSLAEFKANGSASNEVRGERSAESKEVQANQFQAINPGWYECSLLFKRVVFDEENNRFQYVDTEFGARVKAHSAQEGYNKIIEHLKGREDVDSRSQFPSIKGKNFQFSYLGME